MPGLVVENVDKREAGGMRRVDHFTFRDNRTYQMRYAIADQFWDRKGGPVFFYTGNEDPYETFIKETGVIWEWAPDFKALIVFAEHRFYGKSLPFGDESYQSPKNLGYLTSEQALADYAYLVVYLKTTLAGAAKSQFVAFGGSYGGMLATWFRIKYPHLIAATLRERPEVRQIFVSLVLPRHTNRRGGSPNQRFIFWFNWQARLFNESVKNLCIGAPERSPTWTTASRTFRQVRFLAADGVHPSFLGVALMAEHLREILPRGAPPPLPLWSASPSSVAMAADADAFRTTGLPLTRDTRGSGFESPSVLPACGGEHHGP
ncbi:prolylcarboxypeptidase, putative [Ixodes scapularis]|uniref:Prolylcarboxypeptidase, putative n=1 Tax=Ixodes scapularis TaxID=6945 RepID=B7PDZ0_IXOSC|nr:prolylcarboxypeptidase, putative [Ixodes scapularis]|eukprot:XP_002399549.1 prolylcarboxypeptidase, putative [Ixodes scapularis]